MSWLFQNKATDETSSVVPLLLQRLRTTTTIADKRDALSQLAEVTEADLKHLGADGLISLLETMIEFRHDLECMKSTLEILNTITDHPTCKGVLHSITAPLCCYSKHTP